MHTPQALSGYLERRNNVIKFGSHRPKIGRLALPYTTGVAPHHRVSQPLLEPMRSQMKRRTLIIMIFASITSVFTFGWNLTARGAYESAPYEVVEKDGNIEIREYPDLMMAATDSRVASKGRDGSFMRLFRYISGDNEAKQKIEMTTPVFMEGAVDQPNAIMGFVMPQSVSKKGAPEPSSDGVRLYTRRGGKFAVIRFSGRMNDKLADEHEKRLRAWMKKKQLEGELSADTAGYDAPFTPGPFRRNEVLIRIAEPKVQSETKPQAESEKQNESLAEDKS